MEVLKIVVLEEHFLIRTPVDESFPVNYVPEMGQRTIETTLFVKQEKQNMLLNAHLYLFFSL